MGFDTKSEPTAGRSSSFWRVDLQMLPVKAHYFIFMAGLGCVLPFRTVFAKQLGISATAVGVIFLAIPFMKILSNPLCGVIGDYFKRFRLLIAGLVVIVAATHLSMIYIPPLPPSINRSPANNVHVNIAYDFNDGSRLHHLQVFAEVESIYLTELTEFSCEVSCNRNLSVYILNSETCTNSNVSVFIDFKTDACALDFHLRNMSVHITDNFTSSIVEWSELTSFLYRKVGLPIDTAKNCTSYGDIVTISSDNAFKPNNETETLKKTGSASMNEVIGRQKFLLSLDNSTWCYNKAKLSCITHQCQYSDGTPVVTAVQPDEFQSGQFWALFFLISVSSTSFCAVLFLIDAVCYEMLEHKKASYGNQRLWGTIGWGLGSLAGGYLNQLISDDPSHIDYSLSFYFLVVLLIVDLIPISMLKVDEVKYSSNICRDVFFLLAKPDIMINILIVFVNGVLSGLVWNYQFWFMEEIGASQILLGLSQVSECIFAELPCFIIANWVIKKLGYINCSSLSLFCFGIRYLGLAYMYNPWWTLLVGLLNGPSFGIYFAAMTSYGKHEAPPGTEATVQALLAMAFEGIGCGTGSILGGVGFDKFGSRKTFLYSGIASFIFLGINVLLHVFYFRRKSNSSTK